MEKKCGNTWSFIILIPKYQKISFYSIESWVFHCSCTAILITAYVIPWVFIARFHSHYLLDRTHLLSSFFLALFPCPSTVGILLLLQDTITNSFFSMLARSVFSNVYSLICISNLLSHFLISGNYEKSLWYHNTQNWIMEASFHLLFALRLAVLFVYNIYNWALPILSLAFLKPPSFCS